VYTARRGKIEEVGEVSSIYRETFPKHTRSILGHKTCEAYFRAVCLHSSYYLAVSLKDNTSVAGFAVLHFDRRRSLGNQWLFADPVAMLWFIARNPIYWMHRLFCKARSIIRKKKLPLNRAHTTKDVPVFPLGVTAYIDIIAVAESSKRKGVGKLIVKHCVEFAKEKGLRFINLTVDAHNRNAIEFYNKLDFSVVLYNPSSESYVLSLPLETRGN